jgi:PAS domain S-box-containing protein
MNEANENKETLGTELHRLSVMLDGEGSWSGTSNFRKQAEEKAAAAPGDVKHLSPNANDTRLMAYELRVHQIELEMQNEELRRALAELDAVRLRYFDLYDLAPVGYCTLSKEGEFLEVNLTAATLLGVLRGVLVSQRISKYIFRDDQDIFFLFRKQLFETGEPQKCELRLLKSDGSPFWVRMKATVARNTENTPFCRLVLFDITERKHAEAKVQASEIQLQGIIESTADGILAVDNEGKVIKANSRFAELWRVPESLLKSRDDNALLAFVLEQLSEPAKFLNKVQSLYTSDVSDMDTIAFKDGRIFERYSIPMLMEGRILGRVWSFRDITERKRAEQELLNMIEEVRAENDARKQAELVAQHEEALSNTIIDSIPGVFFLVDENGNLARSNSYHRDAILGMTGDQMVCINAIDTIHPEDRALIQSKIVNVLQDGKDEMVEGRVLLRGGPDFIWMLLTGRRLMIKGRPFLVGTGIDITSHKQAENALRESEERFRTLVEKAPEGIFIQTNGCFVYVNAAIMRLFEATHPEELLGQPVFNRFHPDFRDLISERIRLLNEESQSVPSMDEVGLTMSGVPIDLNVSAVPFTYQNRRGALGFVHDISARKQEEEAAIHLAEVKSRFTSVVSHELRSPLATIKEATSLVLEGVLGPVNDEQKDMLNTVKTNIDRLGRLVNNVLAYQKMNTGKMMYDLQESDVNEVVQEADKYSMLFAGDRKSDLVMDLGRDLPKIKFDKDKIIQVLVNLMANAINYSERGPVVIKTRLENSEIQISVRDSGQGVMPEHLDEIFKPFVQAKGKKKGGTGLGLAITKEIVLAHHGQIWVESEVGKGSTFYFTLPV